MKKIVRLNKNTLMRLIKENVDSMINGNDEIDENFFDKVHSVASSVGNDIKNKAKDIGNKVVNSKIRNKFDQYRQDAQYYSRQKDAERKFKQCVKYYKKNQNLFKKANDVKSQIKKYGDQYGFTLQDVIKSVRNNK